MLPLLRPLGRAPILGTSGAHTLWVLVTILGAGPWAYLPPSPITANLSPAEG